LIVPIFGFANAGVSFAGMSWSALLAPVTLGVGLGLFLGKQCGVLLASWIAVTLNIAKRPHGASWTQVYGIALLCGIGFTMSLFIGSLAFPDDDLLLKQVKFGVLAGSLLSGAIGLAVLAMSRQRAQKRRPDMAPYWRRRNDDNPPGRRGSGSVIVAMLIVNGAEAAKSGFWPISVVRASSPR
jgi:NhaA family Na+:H+ antiporter